MIREFLRNNYKETKSGIVLKKPSIVCNDGFWMSIQASMFHFCEPQKNLPDGNYDSIEVYISDEKDDILDLYSDGTYCKYVPIDTLEEVIESHGGIKEFLPADN